MRLTLSRSASCTWRSCCPGTSSPAKISSRIILTHRGTTVEESDEYPGATSTELDRSMTVSESVTLLPSSSASFQPPTCEARPDSTIAPNIYTPQHTITAALL